MGVDREERREARPLLSRDADVERGARDAYEASSTSPSDSADESARTGWFSTWSRNKWLVVFAFAAAVAVAEGIRGTYFSDTDIKKEREMKNKFQEIVRGGEDGYYEISRRKKAVAQSKKDSALFYNFIHIPKTGGTYFHQVVRQAERRVNNRHKMAQLGDAVFPRNETPFMQWQTYPLVDTTRARYEDTFERFTTGTPAEYFGTERLRDLYEKGIRIFSKGSYGMGLCERVNAPCVYLTVLRDPVKQFISHYKYSCLAGAENRRLWNDEMKAKGACDLGILEWYDYLGGDNWLHLLAPGKSDNKDAQVSAAIKNLDAPCFRYLLLDELNDGVEKLKKLPDFRHLDIDVLDERANKNASPGLGARESEQLLKYTNDENVMRELQQRLKRPLAVYAHAVRQYEDQWARSLFSC